MIDPTYLSLVNKLKSAASKSGLTAQECAPTERKRTERRAGRNRFADATAMISEQCNVEYVFRAGSEEMVKLQDWMLDTASTIHITRNSAGLKFIHTVSRGIRITSAGGTTIATQRGYDPYWDEWFWIHPVADGPPLNILSFGLLANRKKKKGDRLLEYLPETDAFRLTLISNEPIAYEFERLGDAHY